jgi:signal peptidase I
MPDDRPTSPDAPPASASGSDAPPPSSPRIVRFWREWILPFVVVGAVLGTFRSAVADWNDVPTGSMEPTILPGDRIFVNKLAYGLRIPFTTISIANWSEPRRGDVLVCFSPKDGTRLVKRCVGVPGDVVELRDNRLVVNGAPVPYRPPASRDLDPIAAEERVNHHFSHEVLAGEGHAIMTTPGVASPRSYGPVTVPEDSYFVLGDNRDSSADSRYFGVVPRRLVVGRATGIVLSLDPARRYLPRFDRFFSSLR